MSDEPERQITFERCINFRDLGGYATKGGRRVRWRRLFRSMTPQFMTDEEARRARDELGIRRVMDLRDRLDIDSGPLGRAPNSRVVVRFAEFAHYPEVRELPTMEVLPKHLEYSAPAIAEAFQLLSEDAAGGTVFHCHTGKDRTGVLAALILRLLDVDAEDVVTDYMLGATLAPQVQGLIDLYGKLPFQPPKSALEAPDERGIRAVLQRVEAEFGGARGYLRGLGVPDAVLERFVAGMLE